MAAGGAVTQLCLPVRLCEFLLRMAATKTSTAVLQRTSGFLIMPQATLSLFCPTRQDECSTYCHNLLWMAVLMAVLLGLLQGKNPYGDLDPLGISNQARHSVQAV